MMLRALKQSRFWPIALALLMAAQLALAFHGVEHKYEFVAPIGDGCALCHVASVMAPGPSAGPIAAPTFHELAQIAPLAAAPPRILPSPAGFRSRAPPAVVSV
ncbi:MAG: hypothetical protein K2P94_19105 [Rhodospirillaceae bacterium]|nr:hypothetical protein [Rhodospirillaceae bacterium]